MGARPLAVALAILFLLSSGLASPGVAWAGAGAGAGSQLSFSETHDPSGGLTLHYIFSDRAHRHPWEVAFALAPGEARRPAEGIGRYEQSTLVARVTAAVTAAVRKYQGMVSAEVRPSRGGYELSVRSRALRSMTEVMAEIKNVAREAAEAYFADSFLKVIHANDVIPDYGRLAARYIPTMRPAAEALAALTPAAPERERLALALAFIQSIPYDEVAAVRVGNGYVVPTLLLTENKGDCDTKSVAMASLLATLLPNLRSAIVLIPGHALLAVDLPPGPGDRGLRHEGRDYTLIEPVGPALLPPGQISQRTRAALDDSRAVTVLPVARP